MRTRPHTDQEEQALCLPTRTVRIAQDGETIEADMGSGRAQERTDWFVTEEEVRRLIQEQKAVNQT